MDPKFRFRPAAFPMPPERQRAFLKVYDQNHDSLVQRARMFDLTSEQAEELVQVVWMYAAEKHVQLLDHQNPRAFLFMVLGWRFIDRHCRPPEVEPESEAQLGELSFEDPAIERFAKNEILTLAVQALPLRVRVVIVLRLQGLKLEEIAGRLKISTAEASRRCAQGLQQLSDFIKRNG